MSLPSVYIYWCLISWPEFAPAPLHVVADDDDTELAPPLPQDGHRSSVKLGLVRVLATWIQQRRHLHIGYVDTEVPQFDSETFGKLLLWQDWHLNRKDHQIKIGSYLLVFGKYRISGSKLRNSYIYTWILNVATQLVLVVSPPDVDPDKCSPVSCWIFPQVIQHSLRQQPHLGVDPDHIIIACTFDD